MVFNKATYGIFLKILKGSVCKKFNYAYVEKYLIVIASNLTSTYVASVRIKLLKTTHMEERSVHTTQ